MASDGYTGPANVADEGNVMRLDADEWLAVVLIDNEGTAHLRDSGEIGRHVLAAALRELADSLDSALAPPPGPAAPGGHGEGRA